MPDILNLSPVDTREQRTVLECLQIWLKTLDITADLPITIANLDLKVDGISIVPQRGVRKFKQYACGGYQVYFPFTLYYRSTAESTDDVIDGYNLIDKIGELTQSVDLDALLVGDMNADSFSQETTTVLVSRTGAVGTYMANFVLIYSV